MASMVHSQSITTLHILIVVTLTTKSNGTLIEDDDGFVLIERHINVSNGYFSKNVLSTGVENEHNPDANTYCIIGTLDENDYLQSDGYYDLKLIYKYNNGADDVLEWTQTSWLTDHNVTGANLSQIVDRAGHADNARFRGLALSPSSKTYLDGNGADVSNWYHAVASTEGYSDGTKYIEGIPAHEWKSAYSSSLWIQPGTEVTKTVIMFTTCVEVTQFL